MKRTFNITAAVLITAAVFHSQAQSPDSSIDDFIKNAREEYNSFAKNAKKEYADFRERANAEYAAFLANPWKPVKLNNAKEKPRDKTLPPQIIPRDNTPAPAPKPKPQPKPTPTPKPKPETRPIVIEEIIDIDTTPYVAPTPIAPVKPRKQVAPTVDVVLYGTTFSVPARTSSAPASVSPDERSVASAWQALADDPALDATLSAGLKLRDEASMCDWMYYRFICALSDRIAGKGTNESALLAAYLFSQSGYATRLGIVMDTSARLIMLPGTNDVVYGLSYYAVDGKNYFSFDPGITKLRLTGADFSGARPMSLAASREPMLAMKESDERTRTCVNYPDIAVRYTCNENLMQFFNDYPCAGEPNNQLSKWSYYARQPLSKHVADRLYPQLRKAIEGKSTIDAANILIDFCEALPYGYDNEIWGGDRAFFADESLYYPKGDCEDHAILFVRLVNDLLHLPTALVYFPGHLAAAVDFGEVHGDYITQGSRRWTMCDPTIFYGKVGTTMTTVDRSQAKLIPVKL